MTLVQITCPLCNVQWYVKSLNWHTQVCCPLCARWMFASKSARTVEVTEEGERENVAE